MNFLARNNAIFAIQKRVKDAAFVVKNTQNKEEILKATDKNNAVYKALFTVKLEDGYGILGLIG